jgi:hypothetical protein
MSKLLLQTCSQKIAISKMTSQIKFNRASFRDPSGFIFTRDNKIYRQVNKSYSENYNLLMDSRLYQKLVDKNLLIPHTDVGLGYALNDDAYKIIQPEAVPFISYPYEWSFSQLKDAALSTIMIQKIAIEFGMTLKDASAYNIQFYKGKPVFIDTLSFEKYEEGQPWVAYKQFCQHFLSPLALMSHKDIRLGQLLQIYIDGIPLDLASSLLPAKTKFNFSLLTNIHLHAKSQKHYSDKPVEKTERKKMSRQAFLGLIDSLESSVKKLSWKISDTVWGNYYDDTNYSETAFENKKKIVEDYLAQANPTEVWDIGANTGEFSSIASDKNINTVSFDIDPLAVEKNYLTVKKSSEKYILPLLLDLTNPTPGIGWQNLERDSFIDRAPVDTVMALALIHHLAIANNLPFEKISELFYKIAGIYLIIEFVPKSDSQVKRLLASREDIFTNYNREQFEKVFSNDFEIIKSTPVADSERTIYLMKKND